MRGSGRRTPRGRAPFLRILLPAAGLLALLSAGCERIDRDMFDNPAFQPQEEPLRLPPADSVPTKGRERVPSPDEARRTRNPVEPTEGNLRAGKELFRIHCAPCHGEGGKGDGPVGKKYIPDPADISATGHGSHHPDGELYAVISWGSGGMPAFRADLSPEERWKIVHHLRTLK